jgi:hypothetical protein
LKEVETFDVPVVVRHGRDHADRLIALLAIVVIVYVVSPRENLASSPRTMIKPS